MHEIKETPDTTRVKKEEREEFLGGYYTASSPWNKLVPMGARNRDSG